MSGTAMLGKVTDLPAVRTAAIASQLSRLVYHEVVQGQQYDFSIPEDADGHALARFVCKAETAACKPHYVVFVVPGTAIFLAYRGTTASFFDACVDITFMPTPLVGTKYLQVHGGINSGAAEVVKGLSAQIRACLLEFGESPVVITGHSLGGGYAAATLLQLLAQADTYPELINSLHGGGMVTFGAPLVLWTASPDKGRSELDSLLYRMVANDRLRVLVLSVVNDLDIVPRLLGTGSVPTRAQLVVQAVVKALPKQPRTYVESVAGYVVSGFLPFGIYHVVVGNNVCQMDQTHMPPHTWLDLGIKHTELLLKEVNQHRYKGINQALCRFITDHQIGLYVSKMMSALEFEPVAFAGGDIRKDYEQVVVQRSTPSGVVVDTAYKHIKSGIHAYSSLPLKGRATAEYVEHGHLAIAQGTASSLAKLAKSCGTTALTGLAAAPLLGMGVLNLGVGVVNLGVSALNLGASVFMLYKMHNIKNTVDRIDKSVERIEGGVARLEVQAGAIHAGVERIEGGVARLEVQAGAINAGVERIECGVARLEVQAGAIQAGVANLTNLMGWQADMIKAALQQLEVLNGQTGQILENQMQMINLLASVDAKADKIQETVNREERVKVYVMMDTLRIKYSDLLSELADLDEVAERDQVTVRGRITSAGTALRQRLDNLVTLARSLKTDADKVQSEMQARLKEVSEVSEAMLAIRQPLVMGFSTAAVVLDVVTELIRNSPSRRYRNAAADLISDEIKKLLRCSTVFKYVTRYHTIMDHYVFLARGLFGQVSMAAELFSREEKTILVYDAADLSWDDGLEAARAMFTRQSGSGDQLPLSFAIDTIELAAWYGDWKGLKPTDKITGSGSRLPEVSVDELLQRLGVFNSDLPKGQKVLVKDDLSTLRGMVLPSFRLELLEHMLVQLPSGLQLESLRDGDADILQLKCGPPAPPAVVAPPTRAPHIAKDPAVRRPTPPPPPVAHPSAEDQAVGLDSSSSPAEMLCDEADAKVAAAAAFAEEGRHVQAGKLFREAKVAYSTACGQSSSEELPVMLFRWGDGLYEIASHSKDPSAAAEALEEAGGRLRRSIGLVRAVEPMTSLGHVYVLQARYSFEESPPDTASRRAVALLHTALSEGFDAALRIDRSFSDALIGAAKVYMELGKLAGDTKQAARHWEQSVDLFQQGLPCLEELGSSEDCSPAQYDLACVLALKGEKQKAIDLLQQLLKAGVVQPEELLEDDDLTSLRKSALFRNLRS